MAVRPQLRPLHVGPPRPRPRPLQLQLAAAAAGSMTPVACSPLPPGAGAAASIMVAAASPRVPLRSPDMRIPPRVPAFRDAPQNAAAAGAAPSVASPTAGGPSSVSSSPGMSQPHQAALGLVLVVTALLGISSVGPLLDYVHNTGPFLKVAWRGIVYCGYLLPGLVWGLHKHSWTWAAVRMAVIAGVMFAVYLGTFVLALQYTSIAHAVVFNNLMSIVLIGVKLVRGQPIQLFEWVGTCIGVTGAILCSLDTKSMASMSESHSLLGNGIAALGSIGGALYLLMSQQCQQQLHLLPYSWIVHTTCGLVMLAAAYLFDADVPSFSDPFNYSYGILGWVHPDFHRLYAMLILGITGCLFGQVFYVYSLSLVSPMLVSLVMLMEPVAATILGIILGVELMPGVWTFVGGFIMIFGIYCVADPEQRKESALRCWDVVRGWLHQVHILTAALALRQKAYQDLEKPGSASESATPRYSASASESTSAETRSVDSV